MALRDPVQLSDYSEEWSLVLRIQAASIEQRNLDNCCRPILFSLITPPEQLQQRKKMKEAIGCARDRTEVGLLPMEFPLPEACSPCVEVPARFDKVRRLN